MLGHQIQDESRYRNTAYLLNFTDCEETHAHFQNVTYIIYLDDEDSCVPHHSPNNRLSRRNDFILQIPPISIGKYMLVMQSINWVSTYVN